MIKEREKSRLNVLREGFVDGVLVFDMNWKENFKQKFFFLDLEKFKSVLVESKPFLNRFCLNSNWFAITSNLCHLKFHS